jgi:hypothetical protein
VITAQLRRHFGARSTIGVEDFSVVSPKARFRIELMNHAKDIRLRALIHDEDVVSQLGIRHRISISKCRSEAILNRLPYQFDATLRSYGVERLMLLFNEVVRKAM